MKIAIIEGSDFIKMTDKGAVSPQVDDTKILLLKEQEENNILKKTLSQKDETIENLKRCLQLYQNSLKENPFNVEAKHNVIECMKEIDDLKENYSNNHGNLITGHNDVEFDDIVIDDVDDLVNFVNTNKDLLGEEHFLKELDASFDVDSEIVKLEDNIDINDLATFPGFTFGGLSEEYSNDDVVSEIMSSPIDNFGVRCVDEDVKELTNKNGEALNKYSTHSRLPESASTAVGPWVHNRPRLNSITGKSMKRLIHRDYVIDNTTEEDVVTVEDDLSEVVDILDSSNEMCRVPTLDAPTKQTPKRRIKRQSDIRITDSAKKWLVENDFQKLFKVEQEPSRKRKIGGSESSTKVYSVEDDEIDSKRPKLTRKGSQSFQPETGGKSAAGPVLYKMFDCSKCGSAFPMDRKDVLNSFYKPRSPRCSHCQTSPKEKEKRAKFNFMSRKKSETSQRNQKMENGSRISQAKINLFSPQSLYQTEQELSSKKSHITCDLCGKQFPMGGEWKFKKHMEVHNKGKNVGGVNKPVEPVKLNVDVKTPVELARGKKKAMELKMQVKQPLEFITDRKKAMGNNLDVEKSVELITEGKQAAEDNTKLKRPVESCIEEKNIKDQVQDEHQVKENPEEKLCDMCQESFKYKSALIAHKKAHEGSSPFQCNLCNKFFKLIDDMVRHGVLDHKRKSVGRLLDLLGRGNN